MVTEFIGRSCLQIGQVEREKCCIQSVWLKQFVSYCVKVSLPEEFNQDSYLISDEDFFILTLRQVFNELVSEICVEDPIEF